MMTYEGVVTEDPLEKHDTIMLVRDEEDPSVPIVNEVPQRCVYPAYLLTSFIGKRVRITVEEISRGAEIACPLRTCGKMNSVGVATCWNCGGSLP